MPYAQRKQAQLFLIDKIMYTATNYLVHENMKKAKDLDSFLFYDLSEVLPARAYQNLISFSFFKIANHPPKTWL